MVNVNKKYFDEGLRELGWKRFFGVIKSTKTEKEIRDVLMRFFSPDEILVLEKRLITLNLLEKGFSYREIGRNIDISLGAIDFLKRGFKKRIKKIRNKSGIHKDRKRYPQNSPFTKVIHGWTRKGNF